MNENKEYLENILSGVHNDTKEAIKVPTLRRFITEQLGYPLEKHFYTTKDGYINTVYRIPGNKNFKPGKMGNTYNPLRPVVIYQHGLFDSCMSFVADEENSLGIKLVNEGFDVWLNNARGNRYSREHQYIDLETCS